MPSAGIPPTQLEWTMVERGEATASFEALVSVPEGQLNLAAAALAFAQDTYPQLERAEYLARLERMADTIRRTLPATASTLDVTARINGHLFNELGFAGNRDAYDDPRNSYLNQVLERRLGIPISLSVIYLEIAWRLGLGFTGVGFPGHFLVKCPVNGGQLVLDPFHGGIALGEPELVRLATQVLGPTRFAAQTVSGLLVSVDRREILLRMLRNLKHIYLASGRNEDAIFVLNRMLLLAPRSAVDVRDRARAYDAMDAMRTALEDYRQYLVLAPGAPDASDVQQRIRTLQARVGRLN